MFDYLKFHNYFYRIKSKKNLLDDRAKKEEDYVKKYDEKI